MQPGAATGSLTKRSPSTSTTAIRHWWLDLDASAVRRDPQFARLSRVADAAEPRFPWRIVRHLVRRLVRHLA
jgi:hypothetical protein